MKMTLWLWPHIRYSSASTACENVCVYRFNGKEVLYANGPPPWIVVPDKEVEEEQQSKNTVKSSRRLKQAVRVVIPKDEVDQYLYKRSFELSDGLLIFEIKRLKNMSKKAAHEFMIELRRRAKAEKGSMPKEGDEASPKTNPREQLPWYPDVRSLFPRGVFSVLSQAEQQRFLAICQTIMNSNTLRFAHNLQEFKEFQKKVAHERHYMASLVVEMIEKDLETDGMVSKGHPLAFRHGLASGFILPVFSATLAKRWCDERFKIDFDFNNVASSIDWDIRSSRRDSQFLPKLVTTVLKGRSDRIQLPNLRNRCLLDASRLYTDFPLSSSLDDSQIFNDVENITSLCLDNGVRIAMDATTACHLMCDPFVGHNYSYAVPIRVVQNLRQGILTNVAFLRQFIKYLLKTTYVHRRREAPPRSDIGETSTKKQSVSEKQRTYSIFSIAAHNILVRSRPPPLCTEGRQPLKGSTLSFQPRVEYVPNAGAMCLSEEESMWNYCKGIFKQSVNHGLFRTHYSARDLLQMQFWETQSFANFTGSDALWTGPASKQDSVQMIANGTFRFSRLLEVIGGLSHGNYMLVNKNDGLIRILNQAGNGTNSDGVLEFAKNKISVCETKSRFSDAFNGLEPVIPLQWQVVQSRAPGCYIAPDSKMKSVAQTPLSDVSVLAEYGRHERKGKPRRRKRKANALKDNVDLPGSSEVPLPNAEVEDQSTSCPFGNLSEPSSPLINAGPSSP
ncbi:hypothetical protein KIN20_031396 [Parelaphostrongylus tenuis]|uniref:Uncharacterized protein n=1 Tax=Parelaphostrongylus tenuis TaxID=148309 RepID=A0AAD5R6N6_PARTN|nr:hypothetical protein KIN20_031396 [Parelaphostrongylus tenuis]